MGLAVRADCYSGAWQGHGRGYSLWNKRYGMLTARQSRQDEEKAIWNQRRGDSKTEEKDLGKVPEKSGKTFCKNIPCELFSHQRT